MAGDELPCSYEDAVRAFGFEPDSVHATPLHHSVTDASLGTWRLHAVVNDVVRDTCVVKIVVPHNPEARPMWQAGEASTDPWYWRREASLLSSGMLEALPDDRVRAARLRGVREHDDGSVALFLEDVDGYPGTRWTFGRYRVAARHLGRWHGAYLAGAAVPKSPVLSHDWLASYLDRRHADVGPVPTRVQTTAEARRLVPDGALHAAQRTWDERGWFTSRLAQLPQVFSHLDLHPANLFALRDDDGVERTVLVDWQFAGVGALGEDIGNLALDAVLDFHVAGADAAMLFAVLLDGYVNGLRAKVPGVSEHQVRFGICATAALKYWWIPIHLARLLDDDTTSATERLLNGRPLAGAAPSWAAAVKLWFECVRTARDLDATRDF